MLKEKIYRFVSEEVRNKVLSEGQFLIKGLGLFFLDRVAAREIAGDDGEISTLPPENVIGFDHRPEDDDSFYIDSNAYQFSGENNPDLPFTKNILLKLFAQVKELRDNEYIGADGLGYFAMKGGKVEFYPDDALAREVNFEFAGQLAVRLKAGQRSYFVPRSPSLEEKLSGLKNVTDREPDLLYESEKPSEKRGIAVVVSESDVKASDSKTEMKGNDGTDSGGAELVQAAETREETGQTESADDYKEEKKSSEAEKEETHKGGISTAELELVIREGRIRNYESEKKQRPLNTYDKVAAGISIAVLLAIVVYLLHIYGLLNFEGNTRTVITSPHSQAITNTAVNDESSQTTDVAGAGAEVEGIPEAPPEGAAEITLLPAEGAENQTESASQNVGQEDNITASEDAEDAAAVTVNPDEHGQPENESARSEPEFGLMGDMQVFDTRPFGIVIHSLALESVARAEMEAFSAAGFRVTIYPTTRADGVVSWRVSVGQFSSIDDAVQAAQTLEEPYRSNNFISRLPR